MPKKTISKNKSKTQLKYQMQLSKSQIGKPSGIDSIRKNLKHPNIWSCLDIEKQLVSYLIKIGRHVCLHLTGSQKESQTNEHNEKLKIRQQKYQNIQKSKHNYEYIEYIAKSLFNWKCSKLSIVYFFRNDSLFKLGYKKPNFKNFKWEMVMKNIKFLLNEQFYYELIDILNLFEQDYTPMQIGDLLIQKSKNLQEVPQIVQNFFILLNKKQIIEQLNMEVTITQLQILKEFYFNSIQQHKDQLYEIINDIRGIMYQEQINDNHYLDQQHLQQFDTNNDSIIFLQD